VVFADEDCHPYRRTQTQVSLIDTESDCEASSGYWNDNEECIYMAIPGQGTTCPASARGCRSYVGNRGNNIREVFSVDDFEDGINDWQYGTLSSMSSYPGGQSLTSVSAGGVKSGQLIKPVYVESRKSYVLSFWAKGAKGDGSSFNSFDLYSVRFGDAPGDNNWFAKSSTTQSSTLVVPNISITPEWQRYELGPVFINWEGGNKNLEINIINPDIGASVDRLIYIDNVQLKETVDNIYLIENSWFTPFSCDNKLEAPYGKSGTPEVFNSSANAERDNPGEMLGCNTYQDRANELWNIKSFERLCRLEAVGCEEMIDTYNSNLSYSEEFNNGDANTCISNPDADSVDNDCGPSTCDIPTGETSCQYDDPIDNIIVPEDKVIYIVNDEKYNCKSENKGCTALGLPVVNGYNQVTDYLTLYKKNLPDSYDSQLSGRFFL